MKPVEPPHAKPNVVPKKKKGPRKCNECGRTIFKDPIEHVDKNKTRMLGSYDEKPNVVPKKKKRSRVPSECDAPIHFNKGHSKVPEDFLQTLSGHMRAHVGDVQINNT